MPDSLHKEAPWVIKFLWDSWFGLAGLAGTLCSALYWMLSRRVDKCADIKQLEALKKEIEEIKQETNEIWGKVSETAEGVAFIKGKLGGDD